MGGEAGTAWAPSSLSLDFNQPFSFRFLFNIGNDPVETRGDGLTFVLAADTGLGGGGSDLGYGGLGGPSVALAIDTFHFGGEPVSPSLRLLQNGDVGNSLAVTETGLGDSIRNAEYAWLGSLSYTPSGAEDHRGTLTGTIDNFLLGSFSVSGEVDFASLAGNPVFYGFTAGTGLATDRHTIQWGAPVPVPEPATGLMLLAGLAGVGWVARRRVA